MPTDEQAVAQKAALEREKAGYERRLALAEKDDDSDKVERYQGLIKGVEDALKEFEPKKKPATKKTKSKGSDEG